MKNYNNNKLNNKNIIIVIIKKDIYNKTNKYFL